MHPLSETESYSKCNDYALQTKQTEAIWQITGRRWVTPGWKFASTSILLKKCGWLSIKQLSFYITVICAHKTLIIKTPEFLYQKLTSGHRYNTRRTAQHNIEVTHVDEARLKFASMSYRWGATCNTLVFHTTFKMRRIFKCSKASWSPGCKNMYNYRFFILNNKSKALRCHAVDASSSKNFFYYYYYWVIPCKNKAKKVNVKKYHVTWNNIG